MSRHVPDHVEWQAARGLTPQQSPDHARQQEPEPRDGSPLMHCVTQRCSQGRAPCPTPLTCCGTSEDAVISIPAEFDEAPHPAREVTDTTDRLLALAGTAFLTLAGCAGAAFILGVIAHYWSIL